MTIIGRRVEAWIGPRDHESGTIVRVDGISRAIVKWDSDGKEEVYRRADLMRID